MHVRTVVGLLALAVCLCLPAVAALAVSPSLSPSLQPDAAAPMAMPPPVAQLGGPAVVDPVVVDPATGSIPAVVAPTLLRARLVAQGTVHAANERAAPSSHGTDAGASRPTLGEGVAMVALPVAGLSLVALATGAFTAGAQGIRGAAIRFSSPLGRFGRALLGLLPAMGLFSRLERGDLMDNPVRARVHDAVAQDPGLSVSEVRSRTGIAWGTAVHHLRRLEQHGMVVSVSQLAHRRYFAANSPAASQRTAIAVVMHPTARRIAHAVNARPGIDQTGICQSLGINNPAASKHLRQFEAQGLVQTARDGRSRLYHPTGAMTSVLGLLEPEHTMPAQAMRPLAMTTQPMGAC